MLAGAALCAAFASGVVAAGVNDWPSHDHDAGGQRFSPLKQITPANVGSLQPAWTFDTGVNGLQVTPLVINGVMYVTAGQDVIALEPETAKVIWRHTAPAAVSRRGVSYWPGDRTAPPRIFTGAGDHLIALDAERGTPAAGFGAEGSIDLKASVRGDGDGGFSLASPPSVYKNIVITGGNNGEQSPSSGIYGDIRGWDVRTGKLLWSFHTVPRAGEPGVETWEGDSWKTDPAPMSGRSSPSIPSEASCSRRPARRRPTITAGTGRVRTVRQLLVALDARPGRSSGIDSSFTTTSGITMCPQRRRSWTSNATVAHSRGRGRPKMSLVFIFDRVTGEPIFGVEERPVPQSTSQANRRGDRLSREACASSA
jgi:quinoprotein glucose dehydrogenase